MGMIRTGMNSYIRTGGSAQKLANAKTKYGEQQINNRMDLSQKMGGVEGYMRDMDAAKAANNALYGQILSGINSDVSAQDAHMKGYGANLDITDEQRKDDATSYYNGMQAKGLQGLNRQGFAGTTVMPTMKMGYGRGLNKELNRISENTYGRRYQLEADKSRLFQNKMNTKARGYGVMERRNDIAPDPKAYGM